MTFIVVRLHVFSAYNRFTRSHDFQVIFVVWPFVLNNRTIFHLKNTTFNNLYILIVRLKYDLLFQIILYIQQIRDSSIIRECTANLIVLRFLKTINRRNFFYIYKNHHFIGLCFAICFIIRRLIVVCSDICLATLKNSNFTSDCIYGDNICSTFNSETNQTVTLFVHRHHITEYLCKYRSTALNDSDFFFSEFVFWFQTYRYLFIRPKFNRNYILCKG